MEKNDQVVALDAGTTKLAVMAGRKNETGRVEIVACEQVQLHDLPPVSQGDPMVTGEKIRMLLGKISVAAGMEITTVDFALSGLSLECFTHKCTMIRDDHTVPISAEELARFSDLPYHLQQPAGVEIIAAIQQEYRTETLKPAYRELGAGEDSVKGIFYNKYNWLMSTGEYFFKTLPKFLVIDEVTGIRDPLGMTGEALINDVVVINAPIDPVKNIYRSIRKAGALPGELYLDTFASAEVLVNEVDRHNGTVLVDIGGHVTSLAVFREGIARHAASLGWGGLALAGDSAERPCVTRLAEWITREIRYTGIADRTAARIILTGGGSRAKGLAPLLEDRTGIRTRIGSPDQKRFDHLPPVFADPALSTCLGMVASGLGRSGREERRRFNFL